MQKFAQMDLKKNALIACTMKLPPKQRVQELGKIIGYSNHEIDQILSTNKSYAQTAQFFDLFILHRYLDRREKAIFEILMRKLPRGSKILGKTQKILASIHTQPLWNSWSISDTELIIRGEEMGEIGAILFALGIASEIGALSSMKELVAAALRVPLGVAGFLFLIATVIEFHHSNQINNLTMDRFKHRLACRDI